MTLRRLTPPAHEVRSVLREIPGCRLVLRTRFRGEECVTRVIFARVPVHYGTVVREVALRGRGTAAGLPEDALLVLEGYRAAAGVHGVDGLPQVLDAGVVPSPEAGDPPRWGPIYVTTRWAPGEPLTRAWPGLQPPQRLWVLQRILEILDGLHHCQVAYGDLKPGNVVVGPDGVHLIDLDTMREVPNALGFAITRDLTPSFAAPEQRSDRITYLASDVYTFGALVLQLEGGGASPGEPRDPHVAQSLPEPWDRLVPACLRDRPLRRPLTSELWRASRGEPVAVRAWDGAPAFGEAPSGPEEPSTALADPLTERVPEPGPPSEDAATEAAQSHEDGTERVPEPQPVAVAAGPASEEDEEGDTGEVTGPVVERPGWAFRLGETVRRFHPRVLLGTWKRRLLAVAVVLLLVFLGIAGLARVMQTIRTADRLARKAEESLRIHKTVPAKNNGRVLDRVVQEASEAVEVAPTPQALGVWALARAWQQRWHYRGAKWDSGKFKEGDALTWRALEAGTTVEALLARAIVTGAACRLMPADRARERTALCKETRERTAEAARRVGKGTDSGWLAVEIRWAAVMTLVSEAARLEAEGEEPEAAERLALAFEHCSAAAPHLAQAPVNGRELLQDCVPVAGEQIEYEAYLEWSDELLRADLKRFREVRTGDVRRVFRGAHPECAGLETDDRGVVNVQKPEAEDPATFCAFMGRVAAGCNENAHAVLPFKLRLALVFDVPFARFPGDDPLPWGSAFKAARDAPAETCRVEGL